MMMNCYLCHSDKLQAIHQGVRDNPHLNVLQCQDCGLQCLDSFAHVTEDYYQQTYTDNELSQYSWQAYLEECKSDDQRRIHTLSSIAMDKHYLDIGCGGGGVLLGLQHHCQSATGVEPQQRWQQQLSKAGLAVYADLQHLPEQHYDLISLFHVLEHIADPIPFLRQIKKIAQHGSDIIIEVPNAHDALLSRYHCEAFADHTYWSAHLFIYSEDTLTVLLQEAGFNVRELQQVQRYPLANHLYWLSQGQPGGHVQWHDVDDEPLNLAYQRRLAAVGQCDTLWCHCTLS